MPFVRSSEFYSLYVTLAAQSENARPPLHHSSLICGSSVSSVLKPLLAMFPIAAPVTPTGRCLCVRLKSAEDYLNPRMKDALPMNPLTVTGKETDGEEWDCVGERQILQEFGFLR